ncbi:hypothetical protein D3C72_2363110 [compost metagenome]
MAIVVHGPDRLVLEPNHLLPDEIGAAKIAVEIAPMAFGPGQVMRAGSASVDLGSAAHISCGLGFDDDVVEQPYIHLDLHGLLRRD